MYVCVYYTIHIHQPVGHFYFLATAHNAAMNMGVQMTLWYTGFIFFVYLLSMVLISRGIGGSHSNFGFSVLSGQFSMVAASTVWREVLQFSRSPPTLFYNSQLTTWQIIFSCGFNFKKTCFCYGVIYIFKMYFRYSCLSAMLAVHYCLFIISISRFYLPSALYFWNG